MKTIHMSSWLIRLDEMWKFTLEHYIKGCGVFVPVDEKDWKVARIR